MEEVEALLLQEASLIAAGAAGARARNLIPPLTIIHMQILKKHHLRLKSFILWIQRYH